jgi:hypothetical protein
MPKRGEKKVRVRGICTLPPSPSFANSRSASASLGAESDRAKPSNFGPPPQRPSEARTVVSPMRKRACITLLPPPGGAMVWSGLSLKRESIATSAPSALR